MTVHIFLLPAFFFFFLNSPWDIYLLIYFGCAGSLLLWTRAFSSCREWGAALLLQSTGFSGCSTWALLLLGVWNLLRLGMEPVSPALAGRVLSTVPTGKCSSLLLEWHWWAPPTTESRSGSMQSGKFHHVQGNDINLTAQHMPDQKRTRETVSSPDM